MHSSRSRFAARLNSSVGRHEKVSSNPNCHNWVGVRSEPLRTAFFADPFARRRFLEHATSIQGMPHQRQYHHERSEEHTSELQSLMRISYAVFCLKKKKTEYQYHKHVYHKT